MVSDKYIVNESRGGKMIIHYEEDALGLNKIKIIGIILPQNHHVDRHHHVAKSFGRRDKKTLRRRFLNWIPRLLN